MHYQDLLERTQKGVLLSKVGWKARIDRAKKAPLPVTQFEGGAMAACEGMPQTSLREVGLLHRLRHPHVVSLLEVVVGSKLDSVFLVLERVDHDLSRLIDSTPAPFTPPVVKRLAVQVSR